MVKNEMCIGSSLTSQAGLALMTAHAAATSTQLGRSVAHSSIHNSLRARVFRDVPGFAIGLLPSKLASAARMETFLHLQQMIPILATSYPVFQSFPVPGINELDSISYHGMTWTAIILENRLTASSTECFDSEGLEMCGVDTRLHLTWYLRTVRALIDMAHNAFRSSPRF